MPTRQPYTIELLRDLGSDEINEVLRLGTRRKVPAATVLTRQGEPAAVMYLLWSGRARYFMRTMNGRKLLLRWISPGDVVGGAALVSRPSPYVLSSETVAASVVLTWEASTIRSLATRRFPKIIENMLFLAKDHLTWYATTHAALVSYCAEERLAHLLVELDRVNGGTEIDATNRELANSVNISEELTSRIISRWQKAGAIRKRRGKLALCRIEGLFSTFSTEGVLPSDVACETGEG